MPLQKCINCNTKLNNYYAKRCIPCYSEWKKGKNNPNYRHGKCLEKNLCVDCGKQISISAAIYGKKRCFPCAHKFRKTINHCIGCGKEISLRAIRCLSCANSGKNHPLWKKHHTKEAKRKMSKAHKNKIVSPKTRIKMGIASKKRWQNKDYRENVLNAMFKARHTKPNKLEKLLNKLLNKLLPKEYKFVGNGKVVLGGFCPDFINCNGQKKIIELYGDYWHTKDKYTIDKDKRRLIVYKKYGYRTLIVWEHELKNIKKVKNRILNFSKK